MFHYHYQFMTMLYKNMKNIIAVLVALLPMAHTADAARFDRMSTASKLTRADGVSVLQRTVFCKSEEEPRYIQKGENERRWCVVGSAQECYRENLTAARKACASEIESVVRMSDDSNKSNTLSGAVENAKSSVLNVPSVESESALKVQKLNAELASIERQLEQIRAQRAQLETKAKALRNS